jgi:hypothetical protein
LRGTAATDKSLKVFNRSAAIRFESGSATTEILSTPEFLRSEYLPTHFHTAAAATKGLPVALQ